MKQISITLMAISLLNVSITQAQIKTCTNNKYTPPALLKIDNYKKLGACNALQLPSLLTIINNDTKSSASKTTSAASRLTGIELLTFDNGGSPNETERNTYNYEGSNGGDLESDYIAFSDLLSEVYNSGYENNLKITQSITLGVINSQTTEEWGGSSWGNSSRNSYTWDGNNNVTTITTQVWESNSWVNSEMVTYTNNGTNFTTMTEYVWNVGMSNWDQTYRHTYNYNGSLLESYVTEEYNSGWVNFSKEEYTYTSTRLDKIEYFDWNGSGWDNAVKLEYSYDGSSDLQSITTSNWNAGWVNHSKSTYTWSSGILSEAILQYWVTNAFVNDQKYTYSHNAFDQITHIYTYSWDGSWSQLEGDEHYIMTYEEYDGGTTITEPSMSNISIALFPNPAKDKLSITVHSDQPEKLSVILYGISGKLVAQWNEEITGKFNKTISTHELPSGTYLLNIRGAKENIAKQITVQH